MEIPLGFAILPKRRTLAPPSWAKIVAATRHKNVSLQVPMSLFRYS